MERKNIYIYSYIYIPKTENCTAHGCLGVIPKILLAKELIFFQLPSLVCPLIHYSTIIEHCCLQSTALDDLEKNKNKNKSVT